MREIAQQEHFEDDSATDLAIFVPRLERREVRKHGRPVIADTLQPRKRIFLKTRSDSSPSISVIKRSEV